MNNRIYPRTQVPSTNFNLIDADQISLAEIKANADQFIALLFYRGYHCPVCKAQLKDFNQYYSDFKAAGIDFYAISTDKWEKANKAKEDWGIDQLPIVYDFPLLMAEKWGLYISVGRPDSNEPNYFSEPGLFIIRPNGELYASSIQTMPFTRPKASILLDGLKYTIKNNYPARGEVQQAEEGITV